MLRLYDEYAPMRLWNAICSAGDVLTWQLFNST